MRTTVLLFGCFGLCSAGNAQAPAGSSQQPGSAVAGGNAQTGQTPSSIMRPALDTLAQALETIRLEKWKTSGAVREEMDGNIGSIRRDVGTTLPPLLANADAAPESVAQAFPAFRNIEALYDVLLRVTAAGRLAAPAQQSAALDHATASLDGARRAFGDQMQSAAIAQERQVSALKAAALRPPPPPSAAPVAPPPTPSTHTQKKPTTRRKAAPKASAPGVQPGGAGAAPPR